MLSNFKKFCCLTPLLFFGYADGQTTEQSTTLLWFDQTVGKENAAIFNGPIYINRYRLNNDTHPYLLSDDFVTGTVEYDGQHWPGVSLLYDIHDDKLVVNSEGAYSGKAISLIQAKTLGFTIHDKTFINLRGIKDSLPGLVSDGYYERIGIGPDALLYIKHHKHRREIIKSGNIYDSFSDQNQLILKVNNNYSPVNSKKEVVRRFPHLKREINDYYKLHRVRAKNNPTDHTAELLQHIYNLDKNQQSR